MLCASVLFINIGGWELYNPDEPRYAQVAREMMKTGNYIVPSLGAETYSKKPPFFFWLITLCSLPRGDVDSFSARLPSAVAALGVILLTFLLGRMLFDPLTGFLAGLILFTGIEFFWLATRAHLDMTLTFWITLAQFLLYCGYTHAQGSRRLYAGAFFCSGLAVLTKGPIGIIIPLLTISLFLAIRREFSRFRDLKPGTGLLIAAGTAALWLVPACITGGAEYSRDILFKETFGIIKNSFSHRAPFYFYLMHFPKDFLPWTLFIPAAVLYFWRQRRTGEPFDILFPLVWFFGGFIFLSCISSKRNIYLLSLYPAAALMTAKFWGAAIRSGEAALRDRLANFILLPLYLFFGALLLCSLGLSIAAPLKLAFASFLQPAGSAVFTILAFAAAAGLAGIALTVKRSSVPALFAMVIITMMGLFFCIVVKILPAIDEGKTMRTFLSRVEKAVPPGDTLAFYRIDQSLFYFLSRDPVPEIRDYALLGKALENSHNFYCLMQEKNYLNAPAEIHKMLTVIYEGMYANQKYVLVIKHPV
jgi:4-amino-4-deoxy-L-arabinose transferase-like glycosyltransferase